MRTLTLPIIPRQIRQPYLHILLSTLGANESAGFTLFINVEPPWDYPSQLAFKRVCAMLDEFDFPMDITINDKRLGLDQNTHTVIQRAFDAGSEFNIHLEDDLVLSPDALDLGRWYYYEFKDKPETYCCYGLYSDRNDADHPLEIVELPSYFVGWGWGVFRANWDNVFVPPFFDKALAAEHFGQSEYFNQYGGKIEYSWDISVNAWIIRHGLTMLIPSLGRSKHGGMYGEHTSIQQFAESFSLVEINTRTLKELGGNYLLHATL